MTTSQLRHTAGTPEGGRFAATARSEADLTLDGMDSDELVCLLCDETFTASRGYGNYCSEDCSEYANRQEPETYVVRGEQVNGTAKVGDVVHYFDIANQNRSAVRVEKIVKDPWGTRYDLRDDVTGEGSFSTLDQPGWRFAEVKPIEWCGACGQSQFSCDGDC